MKPKELLAKSIILLYRETLLANRDSSIEVVKTVLEKINLPELDISINHERDTIVSLKSLILEMCSKDANFEYDKQTLLGSVKLCCGDDERLFSVINDGIEPEVTDATLKRSVIQLKSSLHHFFVEESIKEEISKVYKQLNFGRDKIKDLKAYLSDFTAKIDSFTIDSKVTKDPAIVTSVNIDDASGINDGFKSIQAEASGESVLKTGWQGLNRALQGGPRRGNFVLIGSLQHKFKTGVTLSLFKHFNIHNTPVMIDVTKIPLHVRLSFEDDLTQNLEFLYRSLKENETLEPADVRNKTPEELTSYIREKMGVNGYKFQMARVDATQWTYKNICNYILQLEADGYEIHSLTLDYLALVPTTGCTVGPMGSDMRDMFRRVRAFCNPRKITVVTPHQLNPAAKQLIRDGHTNFVEQVAGKGYWDKCSTIDNEADIEIIGHIEKYQTESWYTMQIGKHRIPTVVDDSEKYIALKMHKIGAIRDDIHGVDTTCRKVGGTPVGTPEEAPFWE